MRGPNSLSIAVAPKFAVAKGYPFEALPAGLNYVDPCWMTGDYPAVSHIESFSQALTNSLRGQERSP